MLDIDMTDGQAVRRSKWTQDSVAHRKQDHAKLIITNEDMARMVAEFHARKKTEMERAS